MVKSVLYEEFRPGRWRDIDTKKWVSASKAPRIEKEAQSERLQAFIKKDMRISKTQAASDPNLSKSITTVSFRTGSSWNKARNRLTRHIAKKEAYKLGYTNKDPGEFET